MNLVYTVSDKFAFMCKLIIRVPVRIMTPNCYTNFYKKNPLIQNNSHVLFKIFIYKGEMIDF